MTDTANPKVMTMPVDVIVMKNVNPNRAFAQFILNDDVVVDGREESPTGAVSKPDIVLNVGLQLPYLDSATVTLLGVDSNGRVATQASTVSSKENIQATDYAPDFTPFTDRLFTYTYPSAPDNPRIGVLADDVEEIFGSRACTYMNGGLKMYDTTAALSLLMNAMGRVQATLQSITNP